jgi:hypothetical protein
VLAAASLHLSRKRGRSDCIARCNPGGGSLPMNRVTRGDTPTPALPRRREREQTVRGARVSLRGVVLSLDAVDGQAWQPEAEDPPFR